MVTAKTEKTADGGLSNRGSGFSNEPSVSIALCTYNGGRYLQAQLESLLQQTRLPDEIVAVDDKSSDDTVPILKRFAASSPVPTRIECNSTNLGFIKNFEKAIGLTSGDVIFLCDQDDIWSAEKLHKMVRVFNTDPLVVMVHSDARLVNANLLDLGVGLFKALELSKRERRLQARGRSFEVLLRRNIVTGAACAIRRTVFEHAHPFPADWIHDEWLALVASVMGRIVRIDEPLILYRQHGRNQIGISRRSMLTRFDELMQSHRNRAVLMRKMLRRFEKLRGQLEPVVSPLDPKLWQLLDSRMEHLKLRMTLPPSRLARAPLVLLEWKTGRYLTFSNGLRSVIRDLLERRNVETA